MEIDTSAAVSLVNEETVKSSHLKDIPLLPSDVTLRTYTREALSVLGKLMVKVDKDEVTVTLPLVIVKGEDTTLLGRDWLQKLKLDWKNNFKLNSTISLQQVLDCHKPVFSNELGTFKKSKVKFYLTQFLKLIKYRSHLKTKLQQSWTYCTTDVPKQVYPLPCIEELFATLSGGESFTILNLSHVYL